MIYRRGFIESKTGRVADIPSMLFPIHLLTSGEVISIVTEYHDDHLCKDDSNGCDCLCRHRDHSFPSPMPSKVDVKKNQTSPSLKFREARDPLDEYSANQWTLHVITKLEILSSGRIQQISNTQYHTISSGAHEAQWCNAEM